MLELRDITFGFSNQALFKNFNLKVAPGERVALLAPSGGGKTTLCRIAAGYIAPQAGCVLVDGVPVAGDCTSSGSIQGVFPVQLIGQHPERALDPHMLLDEALAEAGGSPEENERLMRILGIKKAWLERYPHELSGGELQRFCIARALATNSPYLIADEISTMLDAITEVDIWNVLASEIEQKNKGLIFTSHKPSLVNYFATRIVHL